MMDLSKKEFYKALEPTNERLKEQCGVTIVCVGGEGINYIYEKRNKALPMGDALQDVIKREIEEPLLKEVRGGVIAHNSRVLGHFNRRNSEIVFDVVSQ